MLKQIFHRTLIVSAIIFLFLSVVQVEQLSAKDGDTPTSPQSLTAGSLLKAGLIFQGTAELLNSHLNPATLTLYINKISTGDRQSQDVQTEATACMHTNSSRSVYGLKGFYDSSWRQLYLYEVTELPPKVMYHRDDSMGTHFEPVGLAGELSKDGMFLVGQIAYNGRTQLARLEATQELLNEFDTTASLVNQ